MAEINDGKIVLPKNLNLNTVILVVGLVASFWGQWAIFQERNDRQREVIAELIRRADLISSNYYDLRERFATARTQLDDLIEAGRPPR